MKDEKKRFHNPKRIVILVQNRKNKIKIDLRTAQEKMLPKLDESQRKKVTHFVLKVRQVNNSNFESAIFFICGFSPGFQVLPQKEPFRVDFHKEPHSTKQVKFKHEPETLRLFLRPRKKIFNFSFFRSFCIPPGNLVRKEICVSFYPRVLDF